MNIISNDPGYRILIVRENSCSPIIIITEMLIIWLRKPKSK